LETEEEAAPTPRDRWWSIGVVALLVLPLLVSAVYLWFAVGRDYFPNTDWAVFELRTRDVFHQGLFVGPYSRYGWNHPGPLLFYVLALPYKLMGERSISLHITALLINAAALAGIGWVAFRRGRLPMVIATVVPVVLMTHALGADLLRNPWNPYVPVLPLMLLLLLCWSVAVGDLWMLPIAVAVASFALQSHVGLALIVLAFVAVAVVGVVVCGVRTPRPERRRWWVRTAKVLAVSAGAFALLWFPVFWGTVVKHDRNLRRLFDFFTGSHETAGASKALEVLGLQWGPKPEWIFGARGTDLQAVQLTEARWWLPIGVVLGVAAVVVACKRRSFTTLWLAALLAVGFPAAALAVSNIIGFVYPYLTRWTWVLGTGLGILILWGAWLAVPTARRASVLRIAAPVAVLLIGAVAVMETVDAVDAGTPFAAAQAQERVITRQVLDHLPAGKGPVLIDSRYGTVVTPGIALALEKHGIDVDVTPTNDPVFGLDRRPAGPYRAELVPVFGPDAIAKVMPPGPVLARYVKPNTPAFRRRVRGLIAEAERMPPGRARTALLKGLRHGLEGPETEIVVYLRRSPG
jgi:hypothetical protein